MSRLEKDDKKIGFNLKSFLKRKKPDEDHQKKECSSDEIEEKQSSSWENSIDFHLEMVKKIDALLEKHSDKFQEEGQVEIQGPLEKRMEISTFKTDVQRDVMFNERQEEFRFDSSVLAPPDSQFFTALKHDDIPRMKDPDGMVPEDKNLYNRMMGELKEVVKRKDTSLPRGKVSDKGKQKKHKWRKIKNKSGKAPSKIRKIKKIMGVKATKVKGKKAGKRKEKLEQTKKPEEIVAEVADEKTGLGWKGLGSGRIVFDNDLKEYVYNVTEPQLKKEEEEIKNKVIHLFRISADVDVFGMDTSEKITCLEKALQKIIDDSHIKLEEESKDKIFYYIFREFVGYDKIDVLMHDEGIEDISCDGHGIPVFVYHRDYESIRANVVFDDVDELNSFVVKLTQICDKQISVYEPIIDGRLPDGSRLQVTLAKTVTAPSTFTVRRFREDPFTPIDLIDNNTMSAEMAAYFWLAVENGSSILFCGGTATGKTSALNAFSLFIPPSYKIVSIEDTREINLPHINWIAGTTREGFSTSEKTKTAKDIDMFDLIRAALRQRPRVIIVGEVRGREANTLFQAMATGHISYSTVHASDMHELLQRLENSPISLPRALLTSLDIVVFLSSVTVQEKPVRRISRVAEIIKLDTSTNRLVFMTPFSWISEIDDRFKREERSVILGKIKTRKGWNDERLSQELTNRIHVLEWMRRKNLRSYRDVGKIVSEYSKDPEAVLKKVKGDST